MLHLIRAIRAAPLRIIGARSVFVFVFGFVFVLSLYLCCLVPIRAMGRSTQDNTFPQPFLHNKVLFSSERRCMLLIIVAPQHTTYARCLSQFVICTAETESHFWRPKTCKMSTIEALQVKKI